MAYDIILNKKINITNQKQVKCFPVKFLEKNYYNEQDSKKKEIFKKKLQTIWIQINQESNNKNETELLKDALSNNFSDYDSYKVFTLLIRLIISDYSFIIRKIKLPRRKRKKGKKKKEKKNWNQNKSQNKNQIALKLLNQPILPLKFQNQKTKYKKS